MDLLHLLEDLRDAYPGSLEETILTEILANALDSGARNIRLSTDPTEATLIAVDDGSGMTRRELSKYHDLAATTKRRGRGIGFAGVGIKLGLLASSEVVTETCRSGKRSATSWRLRNRTRAPWDWIEPPHLVEGENGTAVLLKVTTALSHLIDPGFLEATSVRNFQPLFEPEFLDILSGVYPHGFSIHVEGSVVVGPIRPARRQPFAIRVGRQRKPSGVGYLARHETPLPEHERGLAVSTMGKVIRRGWDWLGIVPAELDRIEGLIEVPALADALTLNKGDFVRSGQRGALYLSYRKAIQEAVASQLADWGATPPPSRKTPRTRPIERDLRKVLGDLAEAYPVLATLAERRAGGQKRLPLGDQGPDVGEGGGPHPVPQSSSAAGLAGDASPEGGEAEAPNRPDPADSGTVADPSTVAEGRSISVGARSLGPAGRKRRGTLSLEIRFESQPGDVTLGRLIESTVWVNDAHPAYRRAVASRAEGYHIALAVAAALAPLTVEPHRTQSFVNEFLARWGEAATLAGSRGEREPP